MLGTTTDTRAKMTDSGPRANPTPLASGQPLGPGWVVWTAVTFAAVVYHLLIDFHLGLYGQISAEMGLVKGLWGLARSLLLAWWLLLVALAIGGRPGALRATLIVVVAEGVLLQGAVAIAVAPPPSDAFPWQDIAHFAALASGGVATWMIWRERARRGVPGGGRWLVVGTVVLLVVAHVLSAPLNLEAISAPRS